MELNQNDPGFQILFEDDRCLAVVKPGGLLTQAAPGIDSLELRVKSYIKRREGRQGRIYLGVPHRLDRPVTGVLVLAKSRRMARRLSEQFADRIVKKTYWAVVAGRPQSARGTWTDYLRKVPDQARAEVARQHDRDARLAVLHYETLAETDTNTLLQIELETGRMHQIRVQAGSRDHAIVGDELYGSTVPFGPPATDPRERRIALLARTLEFRHPKTREQMRVVAPCPAEWQQLPFPGVIGEADQTV
jgi:RluA family pseudouridine synthase